MSDFSKRLNFFVEHDVPRAEAVVLARAEMEAEDLQLEAFWFDDDKNWKDDGKYYGRVRVYRESDVNQRSGEIKYDATPLATSPPITLEKDPNRDPEARLYETLTFAKALGKPEMAELRRRNRRIT